MSTGWIHWPLCLHLQHCCYVFALYKSTWCCATMKTCKNCLINVTLSSPCFKCESNQGCVSGSCKLLLPPGFLLAGLLVCVMMGERLRWGGEADAEGVVVVVTAALRFSIRAQWSGDLWVWLHLLRQAAEPQRCRTQEGTRVRMVHQRRKRFQVKQI